jgi:RNA polymerase sigma-70 factor, ECF subfamily
MEKLSEIVSGCKKNNEQAEFELYHVSAKWLMGVCMRYCSDRKDAEDILQETFIKVYNSINDVEFKSDKQFYSWMKTICVNTALNQLRRSKLFLNEDIEDADLRGYCDSIEKTESNDVQNYILTLLQRLPAGYRTVLNLYVFEEMEHKEIAKMLNISESTSKTQLLKARKMFKKMLELSGIKTKIYER